LYTSSLNYYRNRPDGITSKGWSASPDWWSTSPDFTTERANRLRSSYWCKTKSSKKGLGKILYGRFIEYLRDIGIQNFKAITTPTNEKLITFHLRIGMETTGVENDNGIKVIKDYSGLGQDRVVF
jgi:hypothetical protein